ncbi:MAG TPA: 4Fe-4S binding protein [Anaerolineae bacterium]|nr:4Fe-4S binding protein [Anaerolineae bacterium]
MAYVITALCERAGLCVDVCPTDSIHCVEGDAKWPTYYINPDSCISCGACAAECPNEAIFDEGDVEDVAAIAANADFFTKGPGKDLI